MRKCNIAAAIAIIAFSYLVSAGAQERLVRFDGGIGVVPARVGGVANTVRGVPPGGQPWVIESLRADVRTDGTIRVDGRGLLLGGGDNIGTNGGQSVRARLFCTNDGNVAHDSGLVELEPDGDFRIDDQLTPMPPSECNNPVLLIVNPPSTANPTGSWFAAGIPKR